MGLKADKSQSTRQSSQGNIERMGTLVVFIDNATDYKVVPADWIMANVTPLFKKRKERENRNAAKQLACRC